MIKKPAQTILGVCAGLSYNHNSFYAVFICVSRLVSVVFCWTHPRHISKLCETPYALLSQKRWRSPDHIYPEFFGPFLYQSSNNASSSLKEYVFGNISSKLSIPLAISDISFR